MLKAKGFLFDLDGTLVDSLPAVERAYANWAVSKSLDVEEVLGFIHGKQSITTIRHFMPDASEEEHQAELKRMEQIEAEDVSGRITSYNVCYTKLLRHMHAQQQAENQPTFHLNQTKNLSL